MPRCTRAALAAVAALALLAGCNPEVQGNGVYLEQPRDTAGFEGLDIRDGVAAYVTAGQTRSVKVIGDANVVPNIATEVFDAEVGTSTIPVLHVAVSYAYDPTIPPAVIITIPDFSYVKAAGASLVQVKRAQAPFFTVRASGAAEITLIAAAGHVGDGVDVELSEQTLLDATQYPTNGAYVELSGHGTAKLRSDGAVTGKVADDARLDNLLGTGPCLATTSGNAQIVCAD